MVEEAGSHTPRRWVGVCWELYDQLDRPDRAQTSMNQQYVFNHSGEVVIEGMCLPRQTVSFSAYMIPSASSSVGCSILFSGPGRKSHL